MKNLRFYDICKKYLNLLSNWATVMLRKVIIFIDFLCSFLLSGSNNDGRRSPSEEENITESFVPIGSTKVFVSNVNYRVSLSNSVNHKICIGY